MIPTNGFVPPYTDKKSYKAYKKKLEKEKEEMRKKGWIPAGDFVIEIPGETPEEAKIRKKIMKDFDPRCY